MQRKTSMYLSRGIPRITWPIPRAFPRIPEGNISAVTSHVTGPKDKAYAAIRPQHATNDSIGHSRAKLRLRSKRHTVKPTAPQNRKGFLPASSTYREQGREQELAREPNSRKYMSAPCTSSRHQCKHHTFFSGSLKTDIKVTN